MDAAVRTLAGSARSAGLEVEELSKMANYLKQKLIAERIEPGKNYPIEEAVSIISEFASKKFSESLDVSINLESIRANLIKLFEARQFYQLVLRQRVAVFAQGENAEKAKAAGADLVGFEDLAETIQAGNLDFDVIATPDAMRIVGKLGTVLGLEV